MPIDSLVHSLCCLLPLHVFNARLLVCCSVLVLSLHSVRHYVPQLLRFSFALLFEWSGFRRCGFRNGRIKKEFLLTRLRSVSFTMVPIMCKYSIPSDP